MREIPDGLHGRAFTTAEAEALGVTGRMLSGRRFVRITRGIHRTSDTAPTFELLVHAMRLALPPGAILSHVSALRWCGFTIGPELPIHFATNHRHQHPRDEVVLHRHLHPVAALVSRGVPITPPARTFVDAATQLDDRRLLRVGDWLVGSGAVTPDELRLYAAESHLDGVRRARRVADLVTECVASPRESDLRWTLHRAGLPRPEVNVDILDAEGRWLARGDLVFRDQQVLVEYDGWQHERDARQRQWDIHRREQLEAAGWTVIVVTAADFSRPWTIVARVRQVLRARS